RNQIAKINSALWLTCSLNILILGFGLANVLTIHLTPVILILLSIALTISGVMIRSSVLRFSGIFTNVAGVVCFYIDWFYHPLATAMVGIIAVLIPGLILMNKYKKKHV
ncbi:MAG: hypothetical protein AAFO94_22220, partial [Bacteroidota bacterium]